MKHFARMTKTTLDSGKQNVVLMGRKTWESIPSKNQPLSGRLNIVITSQAKKFPEKFKGAITCPSFEAAVKELEDREDQIYSVWVIGGSSVYKEAVLSPFLHRIYLTRVLKSIECDTFLPEIDFSKFHKVLHDDVSSELQEEDGIQYLYEIYEKTS